ncbi:hypothetical protein [Aquibium sp. ELW1220]|uniref:hypothetical protein n=1 Tax=Aquibium sp. ELW1220 TaxID=2976766 RepID=UPI0025B0FB02|nr:hypothetical protein [Aquibium sp. ELW1220]MDN2583034.1 hypothetical protein [Aquibium sp. ELW1220]
MKLTLGGADSSLRQDGHCFNLDNNTVFAASGRGLQLSRAMPRKLPRLPARNPCVGEAQPVKQLEDAAFEQPTEKRSSISSTTAAELA